MRVTSQHIYLEPINSIQVTSKDLSIRLTQGGTYDKDVLEIQVGPGDYSIKAWRNSDGKLVVAGGAHSVVLELL